jgi:four helix bundle protein
MEYKMENKKPTIQSFTDLITWKEAHKLVLMIYKITKSFPKEEIYSLMDQMKRCSVSISSNIAEGFSRKSKKEKIQFYHISRGSVTELQNQLLIAKDVDYISKEDFKNIAQQTISVHKLLNGLIKTTGFMS